MHKCAVIIRMFRFIQLLIDKFKDDDARRFCGEYFFDLLFSCMLTPASIGFNLHDTDGMHQLQGTTKQLCSLLANSMKEHERTVMRKILSAMLLKDQFNLQRLDFSHTAGTGTHSS
jgi:hypothetical protein